jgi:peptide/nickel transport system permease protein
VSSAPIAPLAGIVAVAALSVATVGVFRRGGGPARARFLGHRGVSAGLCWLLFVGAVALLAPLLAPYRPSRQLDIVALADHAPSWQYLLGTDLLSRDLLSRLLYGARVSLGIGALAMAVAATIGAFVGVVSGYFQRSVDSVLMRIVDLGLSIPRTFVILVIVALAERVSLGGLVLVLGLTGWFGTSRLVRAEVLAIRSSGFVTSARALGATPWRIVWRDIVPNATAPLIVSAALGVGNVILLEAALSFLGAGVQAPQASWGNMIADGRDQLVTAPWTTLFPGLAILLAVMALNAVGDGLRDALDPRGATP